LVHDERKAAEAALCASPQVPKKTWVAKLYCDRLSTAKRVRGRLLQATRIIVAVSVREIVQR
ncbi:MAG: hypothetical protein OEW25_03385, partial [Nitrospira sp.]|nr:hypothetical protein [Nitrospira sp.]